jgi:hypothetical protein
MKVNIEDKKFLARFMGWKVNSPMENGNFWYVKQNGDGVTNYFWNPDKSLEQFSEVWNKLSQPQQDTLRLGFNTVHEYVKTLLNDLPKVMQAVLKVIKD